jgi:hypothetical protein
MISGRTCRSQSRDRPVESWWNGQGVLRRGSCLWLNSTAEAVSCCVEVEYDQGIRRRGSCLWLNSTAEAMSSCVEVEYDQGVLRRGSCLWSVRGGSFQLQEVVSGPATAVGAVRSRTVRRRQRNPVAEVA